MPNEKSPITTRDQQKHSFINKHLPPRLQWEHNGGYCGEVSMIVAGLYYGQYLSQYDVRAIASPGMPQNSQTWPGVKAKTKPGYYNAQLLHVWKTHVV